MQTVALNVLPDRALLLWEGPTFVKVLAEVPTGQVEPTVLRRLRIDATFALHERGSDAVEAIVAERLALSRATEQGAGDAGRDREER